MQDGADADAQNAAATLEALAEEYKEYKAASEATIKDSAGVLASTTAELTAIQKALAEEQAAHSQLKSTLEALAQ